VDALGMDCSGEKSRFVAAYLRVEGGYSRREERCPSKEKKYSPGDHFSVGRGKCDIGRVEEHSLPVVSGQRCPVVKKEAPVSPQVAQKSGK